MGNVVVFLVWFVLFHFNRRDLSFCFLRKEEPKARREGMLERTPIRQALGSGGHVHPGRKRWPPSASRAPAVRAGDGREHRATWSLPSRSACPRRGCAAGCGKPGALCVHPSLRHLWLHPSSGQMSTPPARIRQAATSWAGADPLLASALLGGTSTCGARTGPRLPPSPFQPVQILLGLHALMLDTLAICCWGWEPGTDGAS